MRQWQVRRALQPHPDGQRRWDRTYQQLMAWTQTPQSGAVVPAGPVPPPEEDRHEDRDLCTGIHPAPSTSQDGLAQQLERLQAHALQQGWSVAAEDIFRDEGYSGARLKRPGLERLRDRAAMRQLDCILITAPDRMARNYVHQVLLLEEISATGCQVQFLDRPMSQDPHDQLLLQIRGAVAE